MTHDALDQIIEAALCKMWEREPGSQVTREAAWAIRDALLAEGRIEPREIYVNGLRRDSQVLVIPLLVGVGCGNAKKDTRPCGCDFPNTAECACDTSCAHCWPDFSDFDPSAS